MNKPVYKKRYRIRHAGKVRQASREYRQKHKESESARKKAWRAAHKDEVAKYNQEYFKKHRAALVRKRTEQRHRQVISEAGKVYISREA